MCVCFVCSNFTEARERNITARSLRIFFEDSFDYLKDLETFRLTGRLKKKVPCFLPPLRFVVHRKVCLSRGVVGIGHLIHLKYDLFIKELYGLETLRKTSARR